MANQELLATIRDRYRASSRKEKSVNGGEKNVPRGRVDRRVAAVVCSG